jgi:AraC-like DNA-binding protein
LNIPVVRAQHLIDYIAVLRAAGAPVERVLERSKLPVYLEQTPDAYVSLPRALELVWRSRAEVGIMELGFLAGRAASIDTLHPAAQRALIAAPSALSRTLALADHVHRENSAVRIHIRHEGADRRVVCEVLGFQQSPLVGFAEWKVIAGIIDVLRSAVGAHWRPLEITFISRGRPCDATLEAFGNTRILTGQPCGSVLVAAADLARTCTQGQATSAHGHHSGAAATPSGLGDAWDFATALGALVRPYLAQGHPHLSLMAEVVGISERSLQRRLAQIGTAYSEILQQARFAVASDLLAEPDMTIADIAFAAGYENAAHFSRAFKRLTGMTPRDYRRNAA